jgi:glucosylceramidase
MKPTYFLILLLACGQAGAQRKAAEWLTTADGNALLHREPDLSWKAQSDTANEITIDDGKTFQTVDGFGHALTGGSAQLLMQMSAGARATLLHELFGRGRNAIATSYLRVSVGASDMNDHVYTYDDVEKGSTDAKLEHFTLAEDEKYVIPVLREILHIQPHIKILASPWTAPAWMKTNEAVKGGSLKKEFYPAYAQYWVRYLKGVQAHGIRIDALTVQNEPENPKNTPSMVMTAEEEAEFIGHYLGPALRAAGLNTKIIAFDHNCDHPEYPGVVMSDAAAGKFTDGAGYHLYRGDISALSVTHNAFPEKNIYFTEQMVVARGSSERMPIARPVARVVIAALSNWSRNVLLWNLAADPQNGPHTSDGGCPMCSGAITIDGDKVTRLVAYYAAAHASKFIPPNSVRIGAVCQGDCPSYVAFRTPKGGHVILLSNPDTADRSFTIRYKDKLLDTKLPAGAVATYMW